MQEFDNQNMCQVPSRDCQTKDWPNHKLYCSCLPFPAKTLIRKPVYGILLPENGEHPLVEVPLKTKYDPDESIYYSLANESLFLGETEIATSYMPRNPLKPERKFSDTLIISYRDGFLIDGSKPNTTVHKLANCLHRHDWRGPILVTKIKGTQLST